MKHKTIKTESQLKKDFITSLAKEFKTQPVVKDKHIPRTLNAITLLGEHIRTFYEQERSIKSLSKISKCARGLLVLERCEQDVIKNAVHDMEMKLLKESEGYMTGLNGMELSLTLKKSHFHDIQEEADTLMDTCAYKKVISNGAD